MTRLDRHVLVVVGFVALTAVGLALPRSDARTPTREVLESLPTEVGPWKGRGVDADDVLPVDVRSVETVRRIYTSGSRRLWLGVARYTGENGPERRPAIDALVPSRGMTSIAREAAGFPLDGGQTLWTTRLSAHYTHGMLTTWYWYRVGRTPIGDEYLLRLHLGLNTVLRRHHPLLLVRVTTAGDLPADFIPLLVPHLDTLAALAERGTS